MSFKSIKEIEQLKNKVKMAKIMLSLIKNEHLIKDTMMMYDSNITIFEYISDELLDEVQLGDDYNMDEKHLEEFIRKSEQKMKLFLGV